MKHILNHIEKDLPKLLNDKELWQSLYVDYHKPFVKRLWTNYKFEDKNYRICLHEIEHCDIKEALFHPHPWPSIMKLLSGSYEMIVGYGAGLTEPPVALTLNLPQGTIYEMSQIDGWHAVAPTQNSSFSLMISGEPWNRESHKSSKILRKLTIDEEINIFNFFKNIYNS